MTDRPDISEPMKREIRRRCGFGCIICGMPMFDYHHIEDYAIAQKHEADNIVLLCPNHHAGPTRNRVSEETIRHYAASPANIGQSTTGTYVNLMVGRKGSFEAGGRIYEFDFDENGGRFDAVNIAGKTFLGLTCEHDHLLLDIILTDKTGTPVLCVKRGEMTVSTGVWDHRFEGPNIRVQSAEHDVAFALTIKNDGVALHHGLFVLLWYKILVEPNKVSLWADERSIGTITGPGRSTGARYGLLIDDPDVEATLLKSGEISVGIE